MNKVIKTSKKPTVGKKPGSPRKYPDGRPKLEREFKIMDKGV